MWTTGQKAGVAAGVLFLVIVFSILVAVTRKSREAKFLMHYYLKLNTLPKDRDEHLDKEYDAFLCYW